MADWYGKSLMKDEDFQEEDVWAAMKEREESYPKVNKPHKAKKRYSSSSSSSSSSSFSSSSSSSSYSPSSHAWSSTDGGPRMIPRSNEGKLPYHQQQQSSAPMSIPDWSKIYMEKKKSNNGWYEDGYNAGHGDDDDDGGYGHGHVHDEEDDEMVPPHEYITRRLARSQIASFSMCEGVGRTLKGRDLSKLRNAILTKTGFLE